MKKTISITIIIILMVQLLLFVACEKAHHDAEQKEQVGVRIDLEYQDGSTANSQTIYP